MGFAFAGYSSLWAAIGSDVGAMLIVTANGMKLLPSKTSVRAGEGFDSFTVRGSQQQQSYEKPIPSTKVTTDSSENKTIANMVFSDDDIHVYRDAVRLGFISDCQPLDKVDFVSMRDLTINEVREKIGLEEDLLRAYYAIESKRYPNSKECQRNL